MTKRQGPGPIRRSQRHLAAGLMLLLCPALGGCCSLSLGLSSVFCGPVRKPWSQQDRSTPDAAMKTLLAAIAREDAETVYRSLSAAFKKRNDLDGITFQIAWQRMREQLPGIHLLGRRGDFGAAQQQPDGRMRYVLAIKGTDYRFRITLVQQVYWSAKVVLEAGQPPVDVGESHTHNKLSHYVKMIKDPEEEYSPIQVQVPGPEVPFLQTKDVISVSAGREWKVDELVNLTE